jgi:hypothetical protein
LVSFWTAPTALGRARHETSLGPAQLPSVARFDQRADEIGGACECDPLLLSRGFPAERGSEVGLPGPNRTREDDVVAPADPLASRKVGDLCGSHGTGGRREVEGIEGLRLREASLAHALPDRRVAA